MADIEDILTSGQNVPMAELRAWLQDLEATASAGGISAGIADIAVDQAAAINAALAQDGVSTVRLPAGTVHVSAPISIPTGKTLLGAGMGRTIVKALDGLQDLGIGTSVILLQSVSDAKVADLTIDGDELGLGGTSAQRLNGIIAVSSDQFLVERVEVLNCSGYSHWANAGSFGTFRSCYAENCQVCFEQTQSTDILCDDCHAAKTTGNIPCLSLFHVLYYSDRITYRDCTALGNAAAGVDIQGDGGSTIGTVTIDNMHCELTSASGGVGLSCLGGNIRRINMAGSRFLVAGGQAAVLRNTTISARGSEFTGAVGVNCDSLVNGSFHDCDITGATDPGGAVAAKGLYVVSLLDNERIKLTGRTRLRATGPAGTLPLEGRARVWLSPDMDYPVFDVTNAVFANTANTTVTALAGGYYKIEKTSGAAGLNAGADTNAAFAGEFIVEIVVPAFITSSRFGISSTDGSTTGSNIAVSLFVDANGQVLDQLGGTPYSAYTPGDRFWFWRVGDQVQVRQGGATPEQGRLIKTQTLSGNAYVEIILATSADKLIARAYA